MHQLGIAARMAAAIVQESQRKLMKLHEKIDHEEVDELMRFLFGAAEDIKSIANMIEVAILRLQATACAQLVKGGKFKGVPGEVRRLNPLDASIRS